MCGIAGTVNWGDASTLAQMTSVQAHRGPDDSGTWDRTYPDGTWIGLGSRRLAILDLSAAGHMPMSNEQGTLWITYNGEIYNFPELRRELESRGHRFRSHTDTEVVLRLYEEQGPEFVRQLNGMFVLAICDARGSRPELFLARDHFGVKPLYYAQQGRRFAFASEAKSLLLLPDMAAEPAPAAVAQFLTFQWVPEPRTIFRGISKLPPAHYAVLRDGDLKITQYWDLEFPEAGAAYPKSESELIEGVRHHLQRSVRQQMISDVPLGAFLSAGLDSTSIVAMMRRATSERVRTYTITYPAKYRVGEKTLDDPRVAANVARAFHCDHREIIVEPDVVNLLPKLAWHMDDAIADPAALAAYLVCREARPDVTVLLSGVGGDEVFGGYRKYTADRWARPYRRLPRALRRGGESVVTSLPPMRGTPLKGLVRLSKKMARSASLDPVEAFLMNCTYLGGEQMQELCAPALRSGFESDDPTSLHRSHFQRVHHADFLNQMLYVDTKAFMVSLNLAYNDKMSMASSLEVRVPFLDRELMEFAARNIPPTLKIRGHVNPTTKYILRKAMKGILPEEVLRQPKAAFAAPVDYWLAHDLREMVDDLLSERQLRERGFFNPAAVRTVINQHREGRHDWSMQIWQFLTFELWMRAFADAGRHVAQPQLAGAGGIQ